MAEFDYDLFVIGAGSGGVRAARLAAMSGARVGIAEEYRVGGTCVIRGCVPKKLMVYASSFPQEFETARGYGWTIEAPKFDWPTFLAAKDREIARLSGIYTGNLIKAGVDIFYGSARFTGPHALDIVQDGETRSVSAAKVLIATGGRPKLPDDVPGIEHVITSEGAFHLEQLPKRMVIVGGGYIAVEFACIFHGLGVDVTLAYRGPNILRGFDEDVRTHLAEELTKSGLRVVLACRHERIEKREDGVLVSHFAEGPPVESEVVMFATGREPHVKGLGLEAAGVALNPAGAVAVDAYSRTNVEHIWAVGDVTDRMALTPVAIREAQARHRLGAIDIYQTRFRPMRSGFAGGDERMLMKLIVERSSDKVVGCHVVGVDAAEIIQMAAIAVKAGLTKAQWDATCALHPSAAEELVTLREKYVPQELAAAE